MGRAIAVFGLALVGCGEPTSTAFDASTDVDADATTDAFFGFGDGKTGTPEEASTYDVYVTLDDGGGPFVCDNVTCDGRTQYCNTSSVGPPGPAHCSPLPDGCVPANCECLPNENVGVGCSCAHATTGDGLVAGCQLP